MNEYTKNRFLRNIISTDNCWVWGGKKQEFGYGIFFHKNPTTYLAHRASYQHFVGEIPDKLQVCHSCDNPSCVNPDHLFLGTNQDNIDDKVLKNRQYIPESKQFIDSVGEKNGNAKLTETDVINIRKLSLSGETNAEIASKYKISKVMVGLIVRRLNWKHI